MKHGYITKLGEKIFRIKYEVVPMIGRTRGQKTETLIGVSKKEAIDILFARKADFTRQRWAGCVAEIPKDNITLSKLFEGFYFQKSRQKEATTIARYLTIYNLYLKPPYGEARIGQIKPSNLIATYADWHINGRAGRRISARTIQHAHALFKKYT